MVVLNWGDLNLFLEDIMYKAGKNISLFKRSPTGDLKSINHSLYIKEVNREDNYYILEDVYRKVYPHKINIGSMTILEDGSSLTIV